MCVCVRERERETEKDAERERERERHTHTHTNHCREQIAHCFVSVINPVLVLHVQLYPARGCLVGRNS